MPHWNACTGHNWHGRGYCRDDLCGKRPWTAFGWSQPGWDSSETNENNLHPKILTSQGSTRHLRSDMLKKWWQVLVAGDTRTHQRSPVYRNVERQIWRNRRESSNGRCYWGHSWRCPARSRHCLPEEISLWVMPAHHKWSRHILERLWLWVSHTGTAIPQRDMAVNDPLQGRDLPEAYAILEYPWKDCSS